MKILILSPAHPLRGGIAASSERLAMELQNMGLDVVVYSFALQYPKFLFPGTTQYTDDPPPPGLTIKTRLNSIHPLNWLRTGREMAREQPDIIITRFWLPFMGPALGTALRVARWCARKRFDSVALVDNIIPHEKRPGDRLFARWFTGACDRFVVMSKSVGAEIRQFSRKPVAFAPHPIYDTYGEAVEQETARRALGVPTDARTVLFFGFIRAYKGLDLLLRALVLSPGVHAIVAGECYEDWKPYQALIEVEGMADRVHVFTDFIPASQVNLYFSAADLVVQPYKNATQSGISQIAYHFEKPMVVTRVGGLPEIVAHGVSGYVVDPDPEAIAGAINDFFDHNRAAAMRAGVREGKKRFTWKNLADTLLGRF